MCICIGIRIDFRRLLFVLFGWSKIISSHRITSIAGITIAIPTKCRADTQSDREGKDYQYIHVPLRALPCSSSRWWCVVATTKTMSVTATKKTKSQKR